VKAVEVFLLKVKAPGVTSDVMVNCVLASVTVPPLRVSAQPVLMLSLKSSNIFALTEKLANSGACEVIFTDTLPIPDEKRFPHMTVLENVLVGEHCRLAATVPGTHWDRMLFSAILAGAVPHIGKFLVRRRRPNRSLGKRPRTGIQRLGNAWDSFPSGHAVHLGAIAGSLARVVPSRWRFALWSAFGALAATRVMLLAHYPTDVLAGLFIGAAINRAVGPLLGTQRRGVR